MGCGLQMGSAVSGEAQPEQPVQSARPSFVRRIRDRWYRAPLAVTFSVYLVTYLTVATLLTAWLINVVFDDEVEAQFVIAFTGDEDFQAVQHLYSGPYIYDAAANELVPASEFPITGSDALGVFVGKVSWGPGVAVNHRGERPVYANLANVADDSVSLYDWGLNFPNEPMREDVLEYGGSIAADDLTAYDKRMREVRVDLREELSGVLSSNLLVSNVAYYASGAPSQPALLRAIYLVEGVLPFIMYGLLGWVMFRRFYRVYIAGPLGELGDAARRIAEQDLDFEFAPVRGCELGRLACTMEGMRASLLESNRELWRTAEDRRRLNAAFAHDLRTPLTVLKGTVELARMRTARGEALTDSQAAALFSQVERLERYATVTSGLTKLEDRVLAVEGRNVKEFSDGLARYAREVVTASSAGLSLEVLPVGIDAVEAGFHISVDSQLVEEVLDNLLRNACQYTRSMVALSYELRHGDAENVGCKLVLCVTDDGPGFSPEALARGCESFYSENKSASHFGLGLNIARTLARLHGGDIHLENAPEGGARVTATFACKVETSDSMQRPVQRGEIDGKR